MSTYLMYFILYFTQNIVTRGSHVQIPSSTGMVWWGVQIVLCVFVFVPPFTTKAVSASTQNKNIIISIEF